MPLKEPDTKDGEDDDEDLDMAKWTVCVKEDEDESEWDTIDPTEDEGVEDSLFDDKGSARQASASVRDKYDKRKVIRIKFPDLD